MVACSDLQVGQRITAFSNTLCRHSYQTRKETTLARNHFAKFLFSCLSHTVVLDCLAVGHLQTVHSLKLLPHPKTSPGSRPSLPILSSSIYISLYFFPSLPSRLTHLYLPYFSLQTLRDALVPFARATFDIVDISPACRYRDKFKPGNIAGRFISIFTHMARKRQMRC